MGNLKTNIAAADNIWECCKNILACLRRKEFLASLGGVYHLLKLLYAKYRKDRYVNIKGRRIPLAVVVLIAFLGLYCFMPTSNQRVTSVAESASIENNTYNKDGIRVYDLKKCNMAACGLIENGTEETQKLIRVKLVFFSPSGIAVAKGVADAVDLAARTRERFEIACPDDFAYFKLDKVQINPNIDDEDNEPSSKEEL